MQDAEAHMLDYSEVEYKGIGYVNDISYYQQHGYFDIGILDKEGNPRILNHLTNDQGAPIPYTTTVYNFEVADNHTYFIDDVGLWVHDTNVINQSDK